MLRNKFFHFLIFSIVFLSENNLALALTFNWDEPLSIKASTHGVAGVLFIHNKKGEAIVVKNQRNSLSQAFTNHLMTSSFGLFAPETQWISGRSFMAKKIVKNILSGSIEDENTASRLKAFAMKSSRFDEPSNKEGLILMELLNLEKIENKNSCSHCSKDMGKLYILDSLMSNADRFFSFELNNLEYEKDKDLLVAFDQQVFPLPSSLIPPFEEVAQSKMFCEEKLEGFDCDEFEKGAHEIIEKISNETQIFSLIDRAEKEFIDINALDKNLQDVYELKEIVNIFKNRVLQFIKKNN